MLYDFTARMHEDDIVYIHQRAQRAGIALKTKYSPLVDIFSLSLIYESAKSASNVKSFNCFLFLLMSKLFYFSIPDWIFDSVWRSLQIFGLESIVNGVLKLYFSNSILHHGVFNFPFHCICCF